MVHHFIQRFQPATKVVQSHNDPKAGLRRSLTTVCKRNRACSGGICPCYGGSAVDKPVNTQV